MMAAKKGSKMLPSASVTSASTTSNAQFSRSVAVLVERSVEGSDTAMLSALSA